MSEEQLNEMLENIENALWQIKNCKCNVDVTSKGHKWETYYGLDNDLIGYIRKIEKENKRLNNIIDKAINILELSAMNKGICTQIETDTIQHTLSILKGSDKE